MSRRSQDRIIRQAREVMEKDPNYPDWGSSGWMEDPPTWSPIAPWSQADSSKPAALELSNDPYDDEGAW